MMTPAQEKTYEEARAAGWEFMYCEEAEAISVGRFEYVLDARFLVEFAKISADGSFVRVSETIAGKRAT